MADQPAGASAPQAGFLKSAIKMALGGAVGLATGAVAVYSHAIVDQVVKPTKPVANFALSGTEGLTVTFENHATGDSGWWDFGDGSELQPFDPNTPTVTHAYAKPGDYTTKLLVRNFLLEENDRAVSVDLSNPPNALPPTVTGLKVEPIREQAPATYRISGELKNADTVVWKLGDKAEHIAAQDGPFERYVTFEKPGQYPIVLTALSKAMKNPAVEVRPVSVAAPTTAVYSALVSVTDTATRTERQSRTVHLAAPIADKAGPTKGFDRTVHAAPGCLIADAQFDPKHFPAVVRDPKVVVAGDRKTARVTGDWAATGDALAKAAGGTDVAVPVVVTEERSVSMAPGRNQSSGVMDASGTILVKLPPAARFAGANRAVEVDFGLSQPNGQRASIAKGMLDAQGKWTSSAVPLGGKLFVVQATVENGSVKIIFLNAPGG
jgi:hypothetical protein